MKEQHQESLFKRIVSTVFLGLTGMLLILMNKVILTSYKFPSFNFLGMSQAIVIIVSLRLAKAMKLVTFPDLTRNVPRRIFPIPAFYMLNLLTSLGATKNLTVPMFQVLRRLGIVMTLVLEYFILDIKPTRMVVIAIAQIIIGSVVAAVEDLSFSLLGYILILVYDFFGSCEGIYVKKKLDDANSLGQVGVLYYSVLFSIIPIVILTWCTGDVDLAYNYDNWHDPHFVMWFFGTNFMGLFNLYSYIVSIDYNSPLMAQIVSCLRSILVTYIGMFVGGDYIFGWINFIGLNISMMGGFAYSYASFRGNDKIVSTKDDKQFKERLVKPESV
ncbi:UDP-sugar transporter UST74c [Halotydeus destructor]|nr:UDP-sugar transporter UST74c [Halotydeus destructor]